MLADHLVKQEFLLKSNDLFPKLKFLVFLNQIPNFT